MSGEKHQLYNKPKVPLKHFMAAPTAVSNWITLTLLEVVFGLTITSKSRQFSSRVRFIAAKINRDIIHGWRYDLRHASWCKKLRLSVKNSRLRFSTKSFDFQICLPLSVSNKFSFRLLFFWNSISSPN